MPKLHTFPGIVLREGQRPFTRILNFPIFRRKQSATEIFDIIFEKGSSKGKSKKNNEILQLSTDSRYLQSLALLSRKEKLLSIAYSTIVVIYTCFFFFVLGVLLSYFVCYVSMFLSLLVLYLSQPFVLK